MTTAELLERAAERISRGWTRKVNARDAAGRPCPAASPHAQRWSIHGAIACELAQLDLRRHDDDRLWHDAISTVATQIRAETWAEPDDDDHDLVWSENDRAGSRVQAAAILADAAHRARG